MSSFPTTDPAVPSPFGGGGGGGGGGGFGDDWEINDWFEFIQGIIGTTISTVNGIVTVVQAGENPGELVGSDGLTYIVAPTNAPVGSGAGTGGDSESKDNSMLLYGALLVGLALALK